MKKTSLPTCGSPRQSEFKPKVSNFCIYLILKTEALLAVRATSWWRTSSSKSNFISSVVPMTKDSSGAAPGVGVSQANAPGVIASHHFSEDRHAACISFFKCAALFASSTYSSTFVLGGLQPVLVF